MKEHSSPFILRQSISSSVRVYSARSDMTWQNVVYSLPPSNDLQTAKANSDSHIGGTTCMVTMFGNISHVHVGSKSAIKLGMLNLQMEAKTIAKCYCLGPQLPTEHGWLDDLGVDTQFSKYPEDGGQGEIDTGTPFPSCAIVTTCAGVKWHGFIGIWMHMIHFHPSHNRNPYHLGKL